METTLTLRVDDAEAENILAAVRRVDGVRIAKQLKPDSKSSLGRSMAYALVEDNADVEAVRRKISQVAGVRQCSVPPDRFAL